MTTMMVTEQELNCQLQALLENVQRGAEIVISRSGKPLARLLPIESDKKRILFGVLRGKARVAEDFDAPLPEDVLPAERGNTHARTRDADPSIPPVSPHRPYAWFLPGS